MNDFLASRSALSFDSGGAPEGGPLDVVEIPLLLSVRQASALESAAFRRGLTAGEMVRWLLREYIPSND